MFSMQRGEPSRAVRERVIKAREIQIERQMVANARLEASRVDKDVPIDTSSIRLIRLAVSRLQLSLRACHRILKVARTIADLDRSELVREQHVAESLSYRAMHDAGNQPPIRLSGSAPP